MTPNTGLAGTHSEVEAFRINSDRISREPYHAGARVLLSKSYAALGYPDLAAGEAYMAILLVDEIRDSSGEYHEEAVIAAREEFMQTQESESPERFEADLPELPERLERPFQTFLNLEYEKPS
jgi:hypothetical protein